MKRLFEQRGLTVMLVPDSGMGIRSYRLRPARAAWMLSIVAVVVVGSLAFLAGLLLSPPQSREWNALAGENQILRDRLAGLETDLDTYRERLLEANRMEEHMRLVAGLEPIDESVRLMGVGGPDFTAQDPLHSIDADLAVQVHETRDEVDSLLRQTELRRHSYLEILEHFEQQREQWAVVPSIAPVGEGRLSSGYGYRTDPFTKRRQMHRGVDFSARRGAPIVATADGKVIFAGKNANYGLTVKIDHGGGVITLYAHILDLKVKKGDRVTRGQEIARVGSTGRATAPHVHYEVRVDKRTVNPRRYMLNDDVVIN